MNKILPSVKYLQECFTYDSTNGDVYWKRRPLEHFATKRAWSTWNIRYSGRVVRRLHLGYYRVYLLGTNFLLHRIVWKLQTSKEPPEFLDHIDGDRANNCWANLREATRLEQNRNSGFRRHNTSGFRGVYRSKDRWQASIRIEGVLHHLGYFRTEKEAATIFETVARKVHGKFYRAALQ